MKTKIVFVNNYPMDDVWQRWQAGEFPAHHLWGVAHLQDYGLEVKILPFEKHKLLKWISKKVKVLGDLDQQVRLLLSKNDYDLVYSATDLSLLLLAFLRSIGLFNKPIVIFIHRSFNKTLLSSIFVHSFIDKHDRIICLSAQIKNQLVDRFNLSEEKLAVLEWAIDIPFYDRVGKLPPEASADCDLFFMASGKTDRDYTTLIQAFHHLEYSLKIFYGAKNFVLPISNLSPNITIPTKEGEGNFFSFAELLEQYRRSYAIVIPLDIPAEKTDTVTMLGITALLDAMVLSKPVIMTRNRLLNIDVEKEGIGILVEPGDVKGWIEAISYLATHPAEAQAMGRRARELCEIRYSLATFTAQLAPLLKAANPT